MALDKSLLEACNDLIISPPLIVSPDPLFWVDPSYWVSYRYAYGGPVEPEKPVLSINGNVYA